MVITYFKEMQDFEIVGDWSEQTKRLKGKFPQLTDEDLFWEPDREAELLLKLKMKLKLSIKDVIKIIKSVMPEKD
jgi:hypothetical protein